MANVKQAILKKKIGEIVYELLIKTTAEMVYVSDEETLVAKLSTVDSALADAQDKLTKLLGSEDPTSISKQIGDLRTELTAVTDAMKNADEPGSLANLIAANTAAIAAINAGSTGILDQAKKYTDEKLGLPGEYDTMKAYVDAVEGKLQKSIAGAFHFMGTKDYKDQLPEEHAIGDVWQIRYAGASSESGHEALNAEFAWNGSEWVELGSIVDLSGYFTSEQVTAAIATAKQEAIEAAANDATEKVAVVSDELALQKNAETDGTLANKIKKNAEAIPAAQAAATSAAAADATEKADAAQAAAIADSDAKIKETNKVVSQHTTAIEAINNEATGIAAKAAEDATQKATAAQEAATSAAAEDATQKVSALEEKLNPIIEKKSRMLIAKVQPDDLTENDLWFEDVTPDPMSTLLL